MKTLLALLVTMTALSAQAWLKSHYGKLKNRGSTYTCTLTNKTNDTLDMKYVVFSFETLSGESAPYDVQNRIDKRVRSGESITASVNETYAYKANVCKFLAR